MTEPIEEAALKPCPFCGATPHRGLGKVYYDQLHGEPQQNYSIWCPRGHAKITRVDCEQATEEWNTRASPAASGDLRERIARIILITRGLPEETINEFKSNANSIIWRNALQQADAILASLPGRDEEVLLDRVVKFDDCETAEPTLRQMIRQYYIQGLQPDTEHALELSGRFVRSLKTESGS